MKSLPYKHHPFRERDIISTEARVFNPKNGSRWGRLLSPERPEGTSS
jgi:hypothetical protein